MEKKYINYLSVVACFAVVLLHSNGVFWIYSDEKYWLYANIIECVCYFAVPIFFMITGATLIGYEKKYNTKLYFRKRIIKTVIPFLFWSFIGLAYYKLIYHVDDFGGVRGIIEGILHTRYVEFFWFFMPLFAVYIAIPVISSVEDSKKKSIYGYAIWAYIILASTIPLIFKLLKISWNYELGIPVLLGYMVYPVLGYWIDNFSLNKRQRLLIYISGIFGLATHIFGTYWMSGKTGSVDGTFKGYMNLPALSYSVAIFVAFKYINSKKIINMFNIITKPFVKLTFGVYLMQWFALRTLWKIPGYNQFSVKWRLLIAVLCFGSCCIATFIISRIPILRKIVGN